MKQAHKIPLNTKVKLNLNSIRKEQLSICLEEDYDYNIDNVFITYCIKECLDGKLTYCLAFYTDEYLEILDEEFELNELKEIK